MPSLVVTVLGPDRPGLVGAVSDVVRQHGGNWLESRMSHLAGQFAGIILLDVADADVAAMADGLQNLKAHGLKVVTEVDSFARPASNSAPIWQLSVVGNDRPGIVREVTQVLVAHNVNVEELTTECSDAPHSGGPIFRATVRIRLPAELDTGVLQTELENLASDLMIDFSSAAAAGDTAGA